MNELHDNELHDLAALYVVDALTPGETHEFETHLANCVVCQGEVADMRTVTEELSGSVQADPPQALRAAVLTGIANVAQEPRRTAGHDVDNVVAFRPRTPSRLPYLVAAAGVVAALGFGGWGLQSHQDAQRASSQQSQLVQVLGAGDVHTVTGAGPGGSSGTVVLSRASDRAYFIANKMPALSGSQVYELWTITKGAVPAGTFTPGNDTSLVSLPTAALSATSIAITVEPAGGSQQPTSTPLMNLTLPQA